MTTLRGSIRLFLLLNVNFLEEEKQFVLSKETHCLS